VASLAGTVWGVVIAGTGRPRCPPGSLGEHTGWQVLAAQQALHHRPRCRAAGWLRIQAAFHRPAQLIGQDVEIVGSGRGMARGCEDDCLCPGEHVR
jgi:hypothetical protein